ncbi:unnamed protein product [Rhodiola kirilowii]
MRWHAEKLIVDTKMRHHDDSPQWVNVDQTFPDLDVNLEIYVFDCVLMGPSTWES